MSTAIVATLFVQRSKVHCAATYSFCKETWNSWLPWLLVNVLTLSGSTLGLPFADAACKGVQLPDWRQLPMVFLRLIAAVVSEEHWSGRWRLHKAEVHVMDRGEVHYIPVVGKAKGLLTMGHTRTHIYIYIDILIYMIRW